MFIFTLILILGVDYSYAGTKNSESVIGTERSSNSTLNHNREFNIAPTLTTKFLPNDQVLKQEGSGVLEGPGQVSKYKIKVTFDSITIHNDNEGVLSGDGEIDLSAYVQDKRVDLTDASGIWDAVEDETYSFDPGTEITVEILETLPLVIFTAGVEVDGQGRIDWAAKEDSLEIARLIAELHDPNVENKLPGLDRLRDLLERDLCLVNCNYNDRLGGLETWYDAPDYGTGSHEEKSHGPEDFTLRYTISVTPPQPPRHIGTISPHVLEAIECNNNLPVSAVTSSASHATFPPTNAIDNNPSTKWFSTITLNPFITLDLGSQKSVCSVDIAWADGNLHLYKFVVSVSNDGNTFTNVFSGTTTGTTTSPEKYTFTAPQIAKFVKITITESTPGSTNSIAQISEIDLFSGDIASSKLVQPDDNLTFSKAEDIQLGTNTTNGSDLLDSVENATRTMDDGEGGQE